MNHHSSVLKNGSEGESSQMEPPAPPAERIERFLVVGLGALALLAPLVVLPGSFDAANLPQSVVIDLCAGIFLLAFLLRAHLVGKLEGPGWKGFLPFAL